VNAAELAADRAAYIVECVDNSPPLKPAQVARLGALFAVPEESNTKRRRAA
jgi:hypothetical protein